MKVRFLIGIVAMSVLCGVMGGGATSVVAATPFAVVASDATTTVTAANDGLPPATPTGFRMTGRDAAGLKLDWDWTSDAGGGYVARWELGYAGRTVLIDHYYPGYTLNLAGFDLQPGKSYAFELRAIDDSGNRSLAPARLTFETTPPSQPSNLRLVSTSQGYPDVIAFDAAIDNAGPIRNYVVFVNGKSMGIMNSAGTSFSLVNQIFYVASRNAPHGPATVQLRATDGSFNIGQFSVPLTVVFP